MTPRSHALRGTGRIKTDMARDKQTWLQSSPLARLQPFFLTLPANKPPTTSRFSADPGHSAASSFPLELPVRTSGASQASRGLYDRRIRCIGFLRDGLKVRVVLVVATIIRAAGAFVTLIRGAAAALRGSPTAGIVEGGVGVGKPLGRGRAGRSRDGVERDVVVVAGGRDVDRPLRRGVVARRGVVEGARHLGPGSGGSECQDAAGCQNRRSQAEAHGAAPFRLKPRYLNRCKREPLPLAMSGRGDHLNAPQPVIGCDDPLGLNDFGLAIREGWFNGKGEPRTNGLQYADDASGGRCHTASTRAVGQSTRATRSAGTRRRAAVLVGGVRANLSSVLVP